MSNPIIKIVVAAGVICVAFSLVYRQARDATHPAVGKPAPQIEVVPLLSNTPPLELRTQDGDSEAVASDFHGLTLLHFWAVWCPPCRMEYPELIKMVGQFRDPHAFRFISISCDQPMTQASFETLRRDTRSFYEKIGVDVPTYCDAGGRSRAMTAKMMQCSGFYLPCTLLIDREGTVTDVWQGYTPGAVDRMRDKIVTLLKRPSSDASP